MNLPSLGVMSGWLFRACPFFLRVSFFLFFFFITHNLKGPEEFRRTDMSGHEEWKREALRWQVEDFVDDVSLEARLCLPARAHQLPMSQFSSVQPLSRA